MIPRTLHTLRFDVPGAVPSKPNFRKDAGYRKKWAAIKAYQEALGFIALDAGAPEAWKNFSRNPVRVELVVFNSRADLDNCRKIIYDALEGVCFENDAQVVSDEAAKVRDPYGPRCRVTVRYLESLKD